MLVAGIVPVYNVAPYLNECVASICSQTWRQLEILLIDDGSTDGSGEICDSWAEKDARIRVIHQENGGVSGARNKGLLACTGEAIGFADADDWLEPEMYEKLVRALTDADAACCGYVDYPRGMHHPVPKGVSYTGICEKTQALYQIIRRDGCLSSVWNKLFSRDAVRGKRFDQSISAGEDEVWLVDVLGHCKKISFLAEALYHWRPRQGSATRLGRVSEKEMTLLQAKKKAMQMLPQDLIPLAKGRMFNDCFCLIVAAYCTENKAALEQAVSELDAMRKYFWQSSDIPAMRKMKAAILEAEMRFRLPPSIVRKTSEFARQS